MYFLRLFFILFFGILSSCSSWKAEFTTKGFGSIKLYEYQKNTDKVYIADNICNFDSCKDLHFLLKTKLLQNGILLTDNRNEADYVVSLHFVSQIVIDDESLADSLKKYIASNAAIDAFYFDQGQTPRIKNTKDLEDFFKYQSSSFGVGTLLGGGIGAASAFGAFLIPGGGIAMSGILGIGLGLLAFGGYYLISPVYKLHIIECNISEKSDKKVSHFKKSILKISDNSSMESQSNIESNYHHFLSKLLILAKSRRFSYKSNDHIQDILSNDIVNLFISI